ncbi:MAG TPA: T9SS type A sorting domain-containing protein, partial [Candidatus Krumholzibacterium sp.]|nr:T9SS type A sorting domain-containing protein [Candidatus Krumholzibacterium sp.]
LRDIADRVDSMLTFWRWYKGIDYTRLFLTLRKINRAFEARIDTVSLRPLRLTPVRSLFSVPFLIPNTEPPIEVPQYVPLALIPEEEYGYSLAQNFPNPFNPLTTIEFVLAYPSAVSVKVYDLTGREVATLVETGDLDEGFHAVDFDASALASGIYFYRLLATPHEEGVRGFSIVRKMMLIK